MNILIVVSAFATFIEPYFIFYCSNKALGVTGFQIGYSYANFSTYAESFLVYQLIRLYRFSSHKVANLMQFSDELLILSHEARLYLIPTQVSPHFHSLECTAFA